MASDDEFDDEYDSANDEEELDLPRGLKGILSDVEKRELSKFKRTHNKVQYEERLTELQEAVQKKQDFAALKRLKGADTAPTKPAAKAPVKKAAKVESESDSDDFGSDFGSDSDASGDSLDNLFSMDDINKMSNIAKDVDDSDDSDGGNNKKKAGAKDKAKAKPKTATKKKASGKRKNRASDDEEEEEEESDEKDGSDGIMDSDSDDSTRNKKKSSSKTSNLQKKRVSKAKSSSKDSDEYSDSDSDDDGDRRTMAVEGSRERAESSSQKKFTALPGEVSPPAALEDYMKICIRRYQLAQWVFEPFFKSMLPGMFVRISVGRNSKTNENIYRLAEIIEVDMNAKEYKLNELKRKISVRLWVKIGNKRHPMAQRFDKVSNSRLDSKGLQIYFNKLREQRIFDDNFLTIAEAKERREKLQSTIKNHEYTAQQIQEMVEKKMNGDQSHIFTASGALAKLKRQLQVAREAEEWDTVDSLQKDIQKLEAKLNVMRTKYAAMAARTDAINIAAEERNRLKDANAKRTKLENMKGQKTEDTVLNPFLKRETIAKNIWFTGTEEDLTMKDKKKDEKDEKSALDRFADKKAQRLAKLTSATDKYVGVSISSSMGIAAGGVIGFGSLKREVDIDKIRKSVMKNLDLKVDLLEFTSKSKRQRYLDAVCGHLDAQARNEIRQGVTMAQYNDINENA